MHLAETLHRHRDRDDHLAAFVDAHHAALLSVQGLRDFLIAVAILGPEFAIERKIAAIEPCPDRGHRSFGDTRFLYRWRRQFESQHDAGAVEIAAVEDQSAVAVEDAGA